MYTRAGGDLFILSSQSGGPSNAHYQHPDCAPSSGQEAVYRPAKSSSMGYSRSESGL